MNGDTALLHARGILTQPVNEHEFSGNGFVNLVCGSQEAVGKNFVCKKLIDQFSKTNFFFLYDCGRCVWGVTCQMLLHSCNTTAALCEKLESLCCRSSCAFVRNDTPEGVVYG